MAPMIGEQRISLSRVTPRLIEILRVLARHKVLGAVRGAAHMPTPKALRETFEELGVTFLKFGQVLAMRRDMLPPAYIRELKVLHDQLPAMDMDTVRRAVQTSLAQRALL